MLNFYYIIFTTWLIHRKYAMISISKQRIGDPEMDISEAFKEAATAAAEKYEKNKNDSYLSHFYARKEKKLTELLDRLEEGAAAGTLLDQLREDRLRLCRLISEEEAHSTFDWYGEHYYEIIYSGELDGCEEAIAILESGT